MSELAQLMSDLRAEHGNCCAICGSKEQLEFAHITPTGLNGRGRGGLKRAYNIKNNPRSYVLLCRDCHRGYDATLREARRVARGRYALRAWRRKERCKSLTF